MTYVALDPYSPAMPIPTIARNTNSDQYPQARPQSRLPTEKAKIERIIAGLRPKRSPMAPSRRPPSHRETKRRRDQRGRRGEVEVELVGDLGEYERDQNEVESVEEVAEPRGEERLALRPDNSLNEPASPVDDATALTFLDSLT